MCNRLQTCYIFHCNLKNDVHKTKAMLNLLHLKNKSGSLVPDNRRMRPRGEAKRFTLLLILSLFTWGISQAQTTTVKGTVLSSDQQPFPGVTVRVKGTNNGTTSATNGAFQLHGVPTSATLEFSAIGFVEQDKTIPANGNLTVTMEADRTGLNAVVVVGYGTQKKRDVTGAISSISAKDIQRRQPVNIYDALQEQMPGVLVVNDAGEPGAGGTIRVRGYSTFSSAGNSPLFVIDGVISDNADDINPEDIQSVEVLKDAASAAIYGSRAANGVIIITTKHGKEGQPRIGVRLMQTYGKLANMLPQANSDLFRLFQQKQSPTNANAGTSADSLNPSFNADNDYQRELTKIASRTEVDFNVSGGSKKLSYYASLRYLNDQGLVINSWAKTIQSRINLDYQVSSKLKFGNRIQLSYTKKNGVNVGNTLNQALQRPPNFRVYLPDGSLTGYLHGRRNPISVATYEMNQTEQYSGDVFNYLDFDITKDLKFTTNFDVSLSLPHNVYFSPKILSSSNPLSNSGHESFNYSLGWQYQAYLNYKKTIGQSDFGLMAGFSAEYAKSNDFKIAGTDYVSQNIFTSNAAQTILLNKTGTSAEANSLASLFGRASYSYKGKYAVNATIRRDGSSRFGKAHPWGNFPSIGGAWHISNEKFMDWASNWLTDAKVRVSYGVNGNERVGDYTAQQTYVFGNNYYNGISGVVPNSTFGNIGLSWESTHQIDYGLDLSLLKDRIQFTTDYYVKTTSHLLYNRPLPPGTGYNDVTINLGSIQDKGLEFSVNSYPVQKRDFQWNLNFNISFENGIIKKLYNNQSFVQTGSGGAQWLIREGGKIGDFYGWKALGVYAYDQSNAFAVEGKKWIPLTPVFDAQGNFTGYTKDGKTYTGDVHRLYNNGTLQTGGDVHFANPSGDSTISDADQQFLGNAQPKFYAGMVNTFTYKNWSLTVGLNTVWGNDIYNEKAYTLDNYGTHWIAPQPYVIVHAWSKPGDRTDVPEVSRGKKTGNMIFNSRFIENGSFIRVSNARLVYNLSPELAGRLKMKSLSVYLFSTNLATWTNYTGYDPEFSSSNVLELGNDTGKYPKRRELGLGINANF
jgi:TonB-linked SusC/RagA family outer membrane protein